MQFKKKGYIWAISYVCIVHNIGRWLKKTSWATIIFCKFINSVRRMWRDILLKKFLPCWGKRKIVIIGLLGTKGFFELSIGYLHQQGIPLLISEGKQRPLKFFRLSGANHLINKNTQLCRAELWLVKCRCIYLKKLKHGIG